MKKQLLFLLAFLCLFSISCKKDKKPDELTISVSGFSSETKVSIKVTTSGGYNPLNKIDQVGNQTYVVGPLNSGETVTVTYYTNISKNDSANGVGNIKVSLNDQVKLSTGGFLGTAQKHIDIKI